MPLSLEITDVVQFIGTFFLPVLAYNYRFIGMLARTGC